MEYNLPPFGDILRKIRTEQGLSQQKFADYIGISFRQLAALESGSSYPTFETLVMLVNKLEIPLNLIFNVVDKNPVHQDAQYMYEQLLILDDEDIQTVVQTATTLMQRLKKTKGK